MNNIQLESEKSIIEPLDLLHKHKTASRAPRACPAIHLYNRKCKNEETKLYSCNATLTVRGHSYMKRLLW